MGVRWYFTVGLMCISLMANTVEHLFMRALAIRVSSLETCLFKSSTVFSKRIVCVFDLEL